MDKKISYSALLAFSLVELMISLITISLISAAFAPVITKKLSNGAITVGSFGGGGVAETNLAPTSQKDCNSVGSQLVYVETDEAQHTGICVTQYNIGDGNFQIPTGSIDENILAGENRPDGYCNNKKCCWSGQTANPNTCNSTNGSYSGCNRTICNYEAAKNICENLSYGGYSNWRLPNEKEAEYFEKYSTDLKNNGLMLCALNITGNSICETQRVCYGGNPSSTLGYVASDCHPPDIWLNNMIYLFFLDNNRKGINAAEQYKHHKLSTRCVLGAITVKTVSESSCPAGSFLNSDNACISCTTIDPNCASCSGGVCLTCNNNFVVNKNGKCEDPNKKACTLTFTKAGDKQFTIPDDVDEMEVTLVSGGAGGGGGNAQVINHTFVAYGNGNSANNGSTELLTVQNTGLVTYTVPEVVKNKNIIFTLCGAGGGGSANTWGGHGQYVSNVKRKTNASFLYFHIGGYGAGGKEWNATSTGGNAYGGDGTGRAAGYSVFTGWRSGGGSGSNGNGGAGAPYGGGGCGSNAYYDTWSGGGGGAASFVYTANNTSSVLAVASGGGGGGGNFSRHIYGDTGNGYGGHGGGGGGPNGGRGGRQTDGGGEGGGTPSGGVSGSSTIFGGNYCTGGSNNGGNGKPGAIRMTYLNSSTSATGGGGGKIAINSNLEVNSSTKIKVSVGRGGGGGSAAYIADDGSVKSSTSGSAGGNTYIITTGGETLMTTATASGATGGNPNGTTVGAKGTVTNGLSANDLSSTLTDYISTNGGTGGTRVAGGNGGQTTLAGQTLHCNAGAGGNNSAGASATGYGGCGGGGGYGGFNGGNGASGYAKIKFMTTSANCTSAKSEIAYNDFVQTKENLFMKIKIALIQFKDFIVALFNPTIKCKTCMK